MQTDKFVKSFKWYQKAYHSKHSEESRISLERMSSLIILTETSSEWLFNYMLLCSITSFCCDTQCYLTLLHYLLFCLL